ncbi:MAG: sigma-54 dependent transcriptional regulator [Rhodobacteraceae bacterium]|nr:sigma-54 dependent transcriptional regulator [Paracoccaceae bacterium]
MHKPILLIEDTPSPQMSYEAVLKSAGYGVVSAANAEEGIARFEEELPSVVLLDLMMADQDGLTLMQRCLDLHPESHFIVITADGSIDRAVEAMRAGAYEFLIKPFDEQRFLSAIENARADILRSRPSPLEVSQIAETMGFIGTSPAMQTVYERIRSVGRSMATVFISGESGTGKELCAQAIHQQSNRAAGPFIPLNCGGIPSDLLESEVFGHLRGSFTGAIADKPGAAQIADGGTLFLDEICEMDLNLQTKLLRFLQTSTIHPVGSTHPRKVNVRILCATNRDPMDEVRQGRFREDLYYRLHVVPIHMPPLRARGNDVIEIAEVMLQRLAREEERSFTGLSDAVRQRFLHYRWPGNIRQLLNVLRNTVVLNPGPTVEMAMLPPEIQNDPVGRLEARANGAAQALSVNGLIGRSLAEIERLVIEETIRHQNGSVPKAAAVLGVSPSTLYRKRDTWREQ